MYLGNMSFLLLYFPAKSLSGQTEFKELKKKKIGTKQNKNKELNL